MEMDGNGFTIECSNFAPENENSSFQGHTHMIFSKSEHYSVRESKFNNCQYFQADISE